MMLKKLVVLKAGAFEWRGWGIFNDEEQLKKKLIKDWDITEDFDLQQTLEDHDMRMIWVDDFSMQIFL